MTGARRPRRRALVVLAALLPLVAPAVPAGPVAADPGAPVAGPSPTRSAGPTPVSPAVDDEAPVQVLVDTLSPRAPTAPDEPVQVTGRLVNRGELPVRDLSVRLLVDTVVTSRSALAQADAEPGTGRPRGQGQAPADDELAPGASTAFDLRLRVRDLRLGRLGVYPLQVQVRGRVEDERRAAPLGQASTFVPWFPEGPPRPTRLAFLLPLVATPERAPDGALLGTRTLADVGDDGRLTALLEAGTAGARGACDAPAEPPSLPPPGERGAGPPPPEDPAADPMPTAPCRGEPVPLTYAVDPDLLETVQALAAEHVLVEGDGSRAARPGEPAAEQWLTRLQEAVGGVPVADGPAPPAADLLSLPFGDPDVVAAARARSGLVGDLEQLRLLGRRTVAETLGVEPLETVAWPPAGRLSSSALDALAGAGARAVVLDPEALPPPGPLASRTPGARTPLRSTVTGPVDGLVVDDVLSQLLAAGPQDPGWQGDRLAEQRWLVETAIVTAERPETRTMLVVPPRRGEVRPAVAASALLDAGRLPWLCPVSLAAVALGTESCALEDPEAPPEREEDRGELQPADGQGELSPAFLQQVAEVRARADQLTDEVLVAGTEPAARTKSRLLRARGRTLSSAWRDEPPGGRRMLALQRQEVDRLRGKVRLVSSGRVLLTSDTGVVEVGLSNGLDQPVTVGVALNDPVEARLTSSDTGVQTISPGRQVQLRVRVEARVSGRFVVRATMLDRSGQPFGDPVELVARSTRYGRLALTVTGVAAGVLLVAVGVRLFRKAVRSPAGRPDDLL